MRKISLIIGNFGRLLNLCCFFLDKVRFKEPIILVNNDNMESDKIEVAKFFNAFFSYTVKNLEIPEYQCEYDLHSTLSSNSVL